MVPDSLVSLAIQPSPCGQWKQTTYSHHFELLFSLISLWLWFYVFRAVYTAMAENVIWGYEPHDHHSIFGYKQWSSELELEDDHDASEVHRLKILSTSLGLYFEEINQKRKASKTTKSAMVDWELFAITTSRRRRKKADILMNITDWHPWSYCSHVLACLRLITAENSRISQDRYLGMHGKSNNPYMGSRWLNINITYLVGNDINCDLFLGLASEI